MITSQPGIARGRQSRLRLVPPRAPGDSPFAVPPCRGLGVVKLAIEVEGPSAEPWIHAGDWVICGSLDGPAPVGAVVVVHTRGGIYGAFSPNCSVAGYIRQGGQLLLKRKVGASKYESLGSQGARALFLPPREVLAEYPVLAVLSCPEFRPVPGKE